jgi:hypothetical protein
MNQIALAGKDAVLYVGHVPADLGHPEPIATVDTPAISTFRVANSMKNSTINRCSPRRVHTSTVKKSAATISSQWRVKNSFHVVFRLR